MVANGGLKFVYNAQLIALADDDLIDGFTIDVCYKRSLTVN